MSVRQPVRSEWDEYKLLYMSAKNTLTRGSGNNMPHRTDKPKPLPPHRWLGGRCGRAGGCVVRLGGWWVVFRAVRGGGESPQPQNEEVASMSKHESAIARISHIADSASHFCANSGDFVAGMALLVPLASAWTFANTAANASWELAMWHDAAGDKSRSAICRRHAEQWQQCAKSLRPIGRRLSRKLASTAFAMFT